MRFTLFQNQGTNLILYLQALLHYFDKKTGRKSKKPPQYAKKGPHGTTFSLSEVPNEFFLYLIGQKIIARIETTAPICLERFADYPQLGRFTLRDEGKTVAIGKVRGSTSNNLCFLRRPLSISLAGHEAVRGRRCVSNRRCCKHCAQRAICSSCLLMLNCHVVSIYSSLHTHL